MAKKRKQDPVEPDPVEKAAADLAVADLTEDVVEPEAVDDPGYDDVSVDDSDAEKDELWHAHYDEICELHRDVRDAELDYSCAKDVANESKKRLEKLQADLSNLIARGPKRPDPQMQLPFGDDEPESDDRANPDWWRDVPIREVLDLTDKQYEKLDGAGITTFGRFEDVRAGQDQDYPRGLRSIKGVGEKAVDEWEAAVLLWWGRNPPPAATVATADGDATDGDVTDDE